MLPEAAAYMIGSLMSWAGFNILIAAFRPRDKLAFHLQYDGLVRFIIILIGAILVVMSWIIFRMFA